MARAGLQRAGCAEGVQPRPARVGAGRGWARFGSHPPSSLPGGSAEGARQTKGTWWEQPLLGIERLCMTEAERLEK